MQPRKQPKPNNVVILSRDDEIFVYFYKNEKKLKRIFFGTASGRESFDDYDRDILDPNAHLHDMAHIQTHTDTNVFTSKT